MNRLKLPLAIVASSAIVAALVGFTTASKSHSSPSAAVVAATSASTATTHSAGTDLQNTFVSVYKSVSPSVVQIETTEGLGSGIVFDAKGDIVTNAHVVGTSKTFTVTTAAGKQLKGTLVGIFTGDDIAVIKVSSGANLKAASFADSSKLQVGDLAMAIGNPLGLQSSATEGIVSALGRDESEGNGTTLRSAIQTSAAINPGNSGGALVDLAGRVVGIPTLAALDPGMGGGEAAGIGFAIPSGTVTRVAARLISGA
jgi:S1-C subfamily serine protease